MSYAALAYWETTLDIIGLLMCILTLVYIVRIRLADRRPPQRPQAGDFKKEMQAQADDQAAENALERERRNLQLYLGTGLQPASAGGAPPVDRSFELPNQEAPVYQAAAKPTPQRRSGVYSEAVELAACGLSPSQIADKVHIPKGEVELSIKLRNRRKGGK